MDQRTTSLQNSIGIGLNFLLIGQWAEDTSILPTALNQSLLVYDGDVTNVIAQYESVTDGEVFAWEEIITPISQTTIFVHPTTFERYRFNGTTMEVYDDVDGIVPEWLKYEALLTQTGEDAPVARVLNQDERDYFGDIVWSLNTDDELRAIGIPFKTLTKSLLILNSKSNYNPFDNGIVIADILKLKDDGNLEFSMGTHEFLFGDYENAFISIKQRVRGNPPKLISAETNTTGDKVILTFDKKMSEYFRDNISVDGITSFILAGNSGDGADVISVDGSKIILSRSTDTIVNGGDNVSISKGLLDVESLDYGLLQPFTNFPVVNNVIAV